MTIVSVVMPVYNTAKYLEEAIDSILAGSLDEFELIAVNDGSTDSSADILERYGRMDSRVHVLYQDNRGISASRNRGMECACGKYIAVMDSDDVSLPDRLAKQVALMERYPEIGLCGSRCSFFTGEGESVGALPSIDPDVIKSQLLFTPTLSNTSLMMRRDLVVREKLHYDESLAAAEDYDLSSRFSHHSRITNLPDVLMRIRVHDSSTTSRLANENNKWLSMVHRKVLSRLGIEASEDELRVHLSVSTGAYGKSKECVKAVERWLCGLIDANTESGCYDPDALADVLFEKWYAQCLSISAFGLWTWRTFSRSRLSLRQSMPIRHRVPFFVKCLMKKERLRPARARVS
ncbi:MAG: glycosyltransferase family 2 protein [Armatimonadota bacterium]